MAFIYQTMLFLLSVKQSGLPVSPHAAEPTPGTNPGYGQCPGAGSLLAAHQQAQYTMTGRQASAVWLWPEPAWLCVPVKPQSHQALAVQVAGGSTEILGHFWVTRLGIQGNLLRHEPNHMQYGR